MSMVRRGRRPSQVLANAARGSRRRSPRRAGEPELWRASAYQQREDIRTSYDWLHHVSTTDGVSALRATLLRRGRIMAAPWPPRWSVHVEPDAYRQRLALNAVPESCFRIGWPAESGPTDKMESLGADALPLSSPP
ncbi:hypothetical protein MRV_0121 [Murid herpesvirus 3]|uniref:Uncharacterized protein n=2 Tax=Murid betaherpesvirus 3 TaxID=2560603 RepID=A0A1P8VJ20_9BETA|nr:hypothetical protein MRV_0121 [Murine roseolovirus]APZ76332.1 hypothetical protein MRV_0121 [Murid betaherpesvirus 3]AYH64800.1 hypothetical protein MRV_0121 [Murid herpesvirus 3]